MEPQDRWNLVLVGLTGTGISYILMKTGDFAAANLVGLIMGFLLGVIVFNWILPRP